MLVNLLQVPRHFKEMQVLKEWAVLIKAQHTLSSTFSSCLPSGNVLELDICDQAKEVQQKSS